MGQEKPKSPAGLAKGRHTIGIPFPVAAISAALVLTALIMALLAWQAWQSYGIHRHLREHTMRIQRLSGTIVHLDEVLTMSARMATATGETTWEDRYRAAEPQLDLAIKTVKELVPETFDREAAERLDTANLKLVEMEYRAFGLVREGLSPDAAALLNSAEYERQKKIYSDGIQQICDDLQAQVNMDFASHRKGLFLALLSICVTLPILLGVWLIVLRTVRRHLGQRNEAEAALKASEEQFRSVAHTAIYAIISADSHGNIIFWNHSAQKLFGYSQEDILGKALTTIMPKRYHRMHLKGLNRLVGTGKSRITDKSIELYGLRKDGTEFPLELTLAQWHTPEGVFFTSILNDISQRKESEKQRQQLMSKLNARNKELQSVVYAASHDLRAPLVNIKGFSAELTGSITEVQKLIQNEIAPTASKNQIETLLDEDIPEALSFINAGANKINALIEGLLRVSRVGSVRYDIHILDMNEMLQSIIESVRFQAKECGASVTVENLPNCRGDYAKTNQVFSNLLSNALKYLDTGRKGQIHISGRIENYTSTYCVEDNGIGIAPEYHDQVFELFHRLDPDSPNTGEGLGLTIARRIVDRQNGTISVESEPGKGSKFFVSLPTA